MTDPSLPLTSTASCVQVCLFGGREERIVAKMIDSPTQSAVSTIHQLYVPTSQVYWQWHDACILLFLSGTIIRKSSALEMHVNA